MSLHVTNFHFNRSSCWLAGKMLLGRHFRSSAIVRSGKLLTPPPSSSNCNVRYTTLWIDANTIYSQFLQ